MIVQRDLGRHRLLLVCSDKTVEIARTIDKIELDWLHSLLSNWLTGGDISLSVQSKNIAHRKKNATVD